MCWLLFLNELKQSPTVAVQLCMCACSVVFDSLATPMASSPLAFSVHGIIPGKDTGVHCHFLLQGVFPSQGSNLQVLCQKVDPLLLSHLGNPVVKHYLRFTRRTLKPRDTSWLKAAELESGGAGIQSNSLL